MPSIADTTEMSSYSESTTAADTSAELPPVFLDLLQNSCLIPALSSYLRNDSG